MDQKLTDRSFWANFWESKKGILFEIKEDYVFGKRLQQIGIQRNYSSAIELGGFPGYYSVYMKKFVHLRSSLFDYFIHRPIIDKLLSKNGLSDKDIEVIEGDLFNYEPQHKYDMVMSFGLIEHFSNTKDIIERHLPFLNPGGTLFITLPNFRGVNGWVQRNFDPENYSKHYIKSMDLHFLREIATELGMEEIKVSYQGGYSIWLENKERQPALVKLFVKIIWFLGKSWNKLLHYESKSLSPYIVLEGRMPEKKHNASMASTQPS